MHVEVLRDSETNLIACPECNPANCYKTALIRVENRSFPIEVPVVDAQYVYRDLPSTVKPSGWWGVPFFVNILGEGEYCGSSYVSTPYNAYCYFHCDYRPWGGNPPAQSSSKPIDPAVLNGSSTTPAETEVVDEDEIYDDESTE